MLFLLVFYPGLRPPQNGAAFCVPHAGHIGVFVGRTDDHQFCPHGFLKYSDVPSIHGKIPLLQNPQKVLI